MSPLQAFAIAVLQGATELFPVSSLGHAVLLPALLGWHIDQAGESFLPFLVMLHVGTAIALLAYFWRDWWALAAGVLGLSTPHVAAESRRVLALIVIATIPAALLGALLEHQLRRLFGSPAIIAAALAANGLLLLLAQRVRARTPAATAQRPLSALRPLDALAVGIWQCLALVPGFSRSGATITGALLRGLHPEGAAHFSFLIATPIILGATVLEVPKLLRADMPPGTLQLSLFAAVVAGITAWLSTAFLMRWFRNHDQWALDPFAWYCIAAGLGSLAYFTLA